MARTMVRSIRLTAHELGWIRQVVASLSLEHLSDSEAIRSVIYIGLETATQGKWTNRQPTTQWLTYAQDKLTTQTQPTQKSYSHQGIAALRGKLSQAGLLLSQGRTNSPDGELTQVDSYTYFGRTEEERRWEKSALDFLLETDPELKVSIEEMLNYSQLCERDPDNPAFCEKVAKVVVFRARFIKANFASTLTEKEHILVDRLIADGQAEGIIPSDSGPQAQG